MENSILSAHGAAMLALTNKRLAAMPQHEDFAHFARALCLRLWAKDEDSGAPRTIKMPVSLHTRPA